MIHKIYALFDKQELVYQLPIVEISLDHLVLNFRRKYKFRDICMIPLPNRFVVFELGTYDDFNSKIINFDVPFYIDTLSNLLSIVDLPVGISLEKLYRTDGKRISLA